MLTTLIIVHVIVCLLLVAVVLLQFGKGAEAGAMLGQGASQAIFTSSQQGNLFTKLTAVLAVLFMANTIAISSLTANSSSSSIFDGKAPVAKPLSAQPAQPAMPAKAPAKKQAKKKVPAKKKK